MDDDTELHNTISNDDSFFNDHEEVLQHPPISSRPQRLRIKPTYLQDYHCNLVQNEPITTKARYPISQSVDYSRLSSTQKAFTLAILAEIEPKSYKEASLSKEWTDAMTEELNALELNNTWSIMPLPPDRKYQVRI